MKVYPSWDLLIMSKLRVINATWNMTVSKIILMTIKKTISMMMISKVPGVKRVQNGPDRPPYGTQWVSSLSHTTPTILHHDLLSYISVGGDNGQHKLEMVPQIKLCRNCVFTRDPC